jgi:hypothetical protein
MNYLLKRNDNQYKITYSLVNDDGSIPNLSTATVNFNVGNATKILFTKPAVIDNAGSGIVSYTLTDEDTLYDGLYRAEFVATLSDGTLLTYPRNGYISINIQKNVDTSLSNITLDAVAERQGDFTNKLNSILQQAGNITMSTMNEYTWTSTAGQLTYIMPTGANYDPFGKWFEVYVGGVAVPPSLIDRSVANQFTLLVSSSSILSGLTVLARWTEPIVPVTVGHHTSHELNGADEIDITKLRNFDTQVSSPFTDITQKVGNVISIQKYSNLASGNNWNAALQQAVNDASDGDTITVPKSITLGLTGVTITDKTLSLKSNGATILQLTNSYVLTVNGSWEETLNVSSTSVPTFLGSQVVALTVSTTPTKIKVGDVIKIFSDDLQPNALGTQKCGEFSVVAGISGTTIYLSSKLRNTYSTNIRIAKLKKNNFSMEGFVFDTDPTGDAAGWTNGFININNMYLPEIKNLSCLNGYGTFVSFYSCYGYRVSKLAVSNLKNNPVTSNYGYGVNDSNCENGVVENSSFINVRHGFTTNTDGVTDTTKPEQYGSTAFANINSCFAYGCSNSGFDTHCYAYGITYNNCITSGNYTGNDGSGAGFSVRGVKISIINCRSYTDRRGIHVFSENRGTPKDIYIENFKAYRSDVAGIHIAGTSSQVITGVKISGAVIETTAFDGILFENCSAEFINRNFITTLYNGASGRAIEMTNSTIKANTLNIDVSQYTGTAATAKLIRFNDATSSFTADLINLTLGSVTIYSVFDSSSSTSSLTVTKILSDVDIATVVSTIGSFRISFESAASGNKTAVISQSIPANNVAPLTGLTTDPYIELTLTSPNGQKTLGAFPKGYKMGQILKVINNDATNYVVIPHGSSYNTSLYVGLNKTLYPNESVTLIYNGSVWVPFNRYVTESNTAGRPASGVPIRWMHYDTDLNKIIIYTGTGWKDSMGNVV